MPAIDPFDKKWKFFHLFSLIYFQIMIINICLKYIAIKRFEVVNAPW